MFSTSKTLLLTFLLCLFHAAMAQSPLNNETDYDNDRFDDAMARDRFEFLRLRDPATESLPDHIRARELHFASSLPSREHPATQSWKERESQTFTSTWNLRGPYNIGGRTRALAVDLTNTATLLAAGTTGGMWISTNSGQTWTRTNVLDAVQGATCIAQDPRPGKQQTWYYGTGEYYGNSASAAMAEYFGNGIFKSTDGGHSWSALPATTTGNLFLQDQPFDYVFSLAVDPSQTSSDVVYAATYGRIMRSTNGGASWSPTIGLSGDVATFTDVTITKTGVVYAALARSGNSDQGILRSTDGITWNNITPSGFPATTRRIVITTAQSNPNILYVLANTATGAATGSATHTLWKYTYLSGDGTGTGGVWQDLSGNIPQDFYSQASYDLVIKVKPDDPNIVFAGGVSLYRSSDGFASLFNTVLIGGYSFNFHPDIHAIAFAPSNAREMYVGNDGGVSSTQDNLATNVNWTPLNNGYVNGQFYTIGIDHTSAGSTSVIGGLQDNGTMMSVNANLSTPWNSTFYGDGSACAIANGGRSYCSSSQNATIYRATVDAAGNPVNYTRIDPAGATKYLFINPFVLDAANSNIMYLPETGHIWRNSDLNGIPLNSNIPTTKNWTILNGTKISSGAISALATSTSNPQNRLYFGTSEGGVYRLDDAQTDNPTAITISSGKGLPGGYVNCIAVDPTNGSNALLVFSNYNIRSLFYTSDAGTTWNPIGGNLEQNSDGTGDGPSCRWASIMHVGSRTVYFVGTSVGLFSTSSLNGAFTYWIQEGATSIGNAVIDMVDSRAVDGFVAVGTHGCGAFSGTVTAIDPAPTMPTLLFPDAGTTMVPLRTSLTWSSVGNDASYHLQASTSAAFGNPIELDVVNNTSTTIPGLAYNTLYFWRVQAISAGGVSPFTSAWSFTTVPGPPTTPVGISPVTGATGLTPSVTLQWSRVPDATSYKLQIAKGFSFTTLVYSDSTLIDTMQTVSGLTVNQHYFWHVSAANSFGRSANSSLNSFTVGGSSIDEPTAVTNTITLAQNFPDPFGLQTTITFELLRESHATLALYDALGRRVVSLMDERQATGMHQLVFDRGSLRAGTYFLQLTVNGIIVVRPMIILPN